MAVCNHCGGEYGSYCVRCVEESQRIAGFAETNLSYLWVEGDDGLLRRRKQSE